MKVKLIAAIGKNRELGKVDLSKCKFELPAWVLPGDMKRQRELTLGNFVLMGRRTYESLPEKVRPLPDRINIILTGDRNYKVTDEVLLLYNEEDFIKFVNLPHPTSPYKGEEKDNGEKDLWIFGGAEIYKNFIKYADEMYITEVNGEFPECNVFFPEINLSEWELVSKERGNKQVVGQTKKPESHEFYYCVYKRIYPKG